MVSVRLLQKPKAKLVNKAKFLGFLTPIHAIKTLYTIFKKTRSPSVSSVICKTVYWNSLLFVNHRRAKFLALFCVCTIAPRARKILALFTKFGKIAKIRGPEKKEKKTLGTGNCHPQHPPSIPKKQKRTDGVLWLGFL